MEERVSSGLKALESGPLYWFRDWPNRDVPRAAAGAYSVWRGPEFIYVGMSGRGLSAEDVERHRAAGNDRGLTTRLASHASGRRSGDQFCVYVADRLVLPLLTREDVEEIAAGRLFFDAKVKEFIHRELAYRYVVVHDAATAFAVEREAKSGALAAGRPLLNPT